MSRALRFSRSFRLLLLAGVLPLLVACGATPRPNLLLITIDTLRADHLGYAGYPRPTSPVLDDLAAQGAWFARCYSQSAGTSPSHVSLFTGRHPRSTGCLANGHRFPQLTSLMDVLASGGYETAGFVSSIVTAKLAIDGEFNHFDKRLWRGERNRPQHLERPAEQTLAAAGDWICERDQGTPWFAWIHLIDPHGPYEAPADPDRFVGDSYARDHRDLPVGDSNWTRRHIPAYQALPASTEAAYYVARYDAEIAYTDAALGRFLQRLRTAGQYRPTLLVITADHGETLTEPTRQRLLSHSVVTYDEVIRVPLLIKEAGSATTLTSLPRQRLIRLIDLMPTLLDRLGLPVPAGVEGQSLLASTEEPALVFSFGEYGSPALERYIGTQLTVKKGPWQYLINTADGSEELYNLAHDPGQEHNRAAEQPPVLGELRQALLDFHRQSPPAPSQGIDLTPEVRRQLEALGYTTE